MEELGFSEGIWRFGSFVAIFALMVILEAFWPRRKRRHSRVRRWATNIGIMASSYLTVSLLTLVLANLLVPISALLAAIYAKQWGFGLFNWLDLPIWLEWMMAFLILDFVIWGQHWATHKIPILWRLHRVHHSDHDLDASSAIRFHPLEIVFSIFVKAAAVVILGAPAVLVVIFEGVVNGTALFNHANYKLPIWLDRIIRPVLVTPDMHRVHHSIEVGETNSNYGFALSIWDRLFNTYIDQPAAGHDKMIVGLKEYQGDGPQNFVWSIWFPFVNKKPKKIETQETENQ
ncbi:sterol desaturase family protein [Maritalea porphyrae]|uniref:sterol desaturase family protein n=1 Tax=Maritalea porphyrae TaxID=880732 RepID=UPI0022AE6CA6|nr:sterol desaturase family protein [Maritalea porphyrae]MCZ4273279.1 sterol desaturase family protein [Maritalea porphyrae]